jgi:hypothetical protein
MGIAVPVAPAPAHAARWADGPCADNVGITVVIDFQELGGGVNVRCAPGPVTSGLDALDKAGIAWEGTQRFPGFVCRIAGLPGPDREACGSTPPASAYWSYWLAPRGGEWCYTSAGPGSRTPPPGTIEGWSFALDRGSVDTPPPRFEPPAPIPGEPPNPLRRADCGTPSGGAPAAPPPQPAATTTAATTAPAPPIAEVPDPGLASAATEPGEVTADAPTASSAAQPASNAASTTSPGAATSSSAAATSTTRPPTSSTSTTDPDGRPESTDETTTPPIGSAAALGTVDLGDDGRGEGGFSPATGLGILIIAGVGGSSIWAARRRRASP